MNDRRDEPPKQSVPAPGADAELLRKNEELAHSLAIAQTALEATTDAIMVVDDAGRMAAWNSRLVEFWGLPQLIIDSREPSRIQQFASLQVRHPEAFLARIRQIAESGGRDSFDVLELADGRILERYSRCRRAEGEKYARVWSFRDVTAQRRAHHVLAENSERLRLALDAGRLGDWTWVARTDEVTLSQRAAAIFDIPADARITWRELRNRLFEEDRERARAAVEESLSSRSDYEIEYRVVQKSGSLIWVAARGLGNYSPTGEVLGMAGVIQDITGSKRSEEANSRLAAVVESSDDAIVSKTLDGVIRTWNAGAQRIFGYSPEEVIGKPISMLIPPDRINEEPGILERLKNGERIDHYETVRMRKDKTLFDVSLTVSPVKDASGRIIGASKIARDITDRKRAEIALKRSEEQLRLITDATPGLIGYISSDYRYLFVNQQYETWFAIPREQILGMHVRDLVGDEAMQNLWPHIERAFAGERVHCELEVPYRKAGKRFVDIFYIPDADAKGQVRGIYVRVIDISHRKTIEDALRDETRILELLNDTGTAIASKLDLDSLVQTITHSSTQLSGAKFGAFYCNLANDGKSFVLYALSGSLRVTSEGTNLPRESPLFTRTCCGCQIVRIDDLAEEPAQAGKTPFHGMIENNLPVRSYLAVPVVSRSGEIIGGLFFGHPDPHVFTGKSERLIAGVAAQAAVAIDNARLYDAAQKEIAQRRKTEEELAAARDSAEAANRSKDQFLAALSHELRTPLTPVLAILSNLSEEATLPESTLNDFEMIRRNIELEARLIDDLLDLSRVSAGKLELHPNAVNPKEIIASALGTCQPEIAAKSLLIVEEFRHGALTIAVDQARITQVLWNLLKNSIKFTPSGGTITLRTRQDGQRLLMEVQDTGMGIIPSEIGRIFDKFEQGDRSITRQFGGLGLGLAISRAIMEAHDGEITAFSAGPGQGSTFTLCLPLNGRLAVRAEDGDSEKPSAASSDAIPEQSTYPQRILLVEDHSDTAGVLVRLLRKMGHQVAHANSVSEALALAEKWNQEGENFDLVISDLGLPDGSGLVLMQTLSTRYRLRGIALSGYGMESDVRQSAAAGFSHHLIKPVGITNLRRCIAAISRSE